MAKRCAGNLGGSPAEPRCVRAGVADRAVFIRHFIRREAADAGVCWFARSLKPDVVLFFLRLVNLMAAAAAFADLRGGRLPGVQVLRLGGLHGRLPGANDSVSSGFPNVVLDTSGHQQ